MSAENEDQKPVGYGVAFPLSVLPPFYLIYRERSPPWKLGLESQQDHPWFVVNIIPFLYPTNLLLGCMSYGSPEWQDWVLGEKQALEHIKFACVRDALIPRDGFSEIVVTRTDSTTESTPSTPLTHTPTAYPRSSSERHSSNSISLERKSLF